ncbi:MAG TPA: type II secretion system protein GspM [Candidatus Limnocylindrales bacterium]|nr:type II secretion system protein GspM [Candidatus Limnocylindrales bacterium]
MKQFLHQIELALSRLSPREQRLVAIFGGLLAVVVVWSFLLAPVLAGRQQLAEEIVTLSEDLADLEKLSRQIRAAQAGGAAKARPTESDAGFSLLAFVDKAARASLRAESIAAMSPGQRALDQGRQESMVELRLSAVTLPEIVELLRSIEDDDSAVYVKQFHMKKRYEDPSQFDVTLVTATVTRI